MTTPTTQQIASIQSLYVAYFNRAADVSGLQYWEGVLANSSNPASVLAQISASFSTSVEYQSIYAGLTNFNIVDKVYVNLFGHDGDLPGLQYWTNLLNQGKITISNVVTQIAGGAQGTDLVAYNSKVSGAIAFTNSLDTGTKAIAYSGTFANAQAATWLSGITSADTLTSQTAAIPSVINAIENGPSQAIALTTNADNITAQHVVVTGYTSASGVQGTYNPGDQITPTGTDNSLIVNDYQPTSYFNGTPSGWYATVLSGATVSNVQTVTFNSNEAVIADTVNSTLGFSGLTQLNINSVSYQYGYGYNSSFYGSDIITAADTTAITVNDLLAGNAGGEGVSGLTVNGGSTVFINESNGKFANGGIITVSGGKLTSSVTINQSESKGQSSQNILINDVYGTKDGHQSLLGKTGTITAVALDGLNTAYGSNVINSDVLSSLSVTNSKNAVLSLSNQLHNTYSTTLLNLTVGNDVGLKLYDEWNNYQTLNVTTGAKGSTVGFSNFTSVTSETVSGSSVLTQDSTLGLDSLKTITVSGGAGFISDLSGLSKLTSVTADSTSTGLVGVALNAQKTSFTGSAGQDAVLISNDATKLIKAGSARGNEIVLNNNATAFSQTYTGANVQGFTTLGVANDSLGVFALSGKTALFSGINAVDVITQTAGDVTFTGASQATTLTFDGYNGSNYNNVTFQTADTTGATDSLNITLGISTAYAASLGTSLVTPTNTGFTAANILTLSDSNNVGIANLTINSSTIALGNHGTYSTVAADGYNTITTLNDAGLTSLHLTGTGGFTTYNLTVTGTSLTVTDDSTSQWGIYFGTSLSGVNLTTLNFAGSNVNSTIAAGGATYIDSLVLGTSTLTVKDSFAGDVYIGGLSTTATHSVTADGITTVTPDYLTSLTLTNTSTAGILEVNAVQDNNLSSLTLSGNVIYNSLLGNIDNLVFGSMGNAWGYDTVTTGITVSGATDNANVWFWTANNGGANADGLNSTAVDTITLGNGNNNVADGGLGTVNISVGTGSNHVWAYNFIYGGGNPSNDKYTSGADTITLAAHDVSSTDVVGVGQTQKYNTSTGETVGYSVISGLNNVSTSQDEIVFAADNGVNGAQGAVNVLSGTFTNINDWFAAAETAAVATTHQIEAFNFGGNTYLVESNSNFGVTVVELVGVSTTTAAHFVASNGALAVHV